ncbi:MAG: DUF4364 family protein [Clostridia bacterium]|nr:DUF4364 family protein [Clostridia bacterium]
MNLENSRELAENKLIVLYIIDKLNIAISNLQLTKIVLENRFMNYFSLQQFLNELCDHHHLSINEADNTCFYTITDHGKQTLDYFINLIPLGLKSRIDEMASSIRKNIKNETLITSDYEPGSGNEFIVSCNVNEDNFPLIDLKITVGAKNDARLVCENWKKYSQEIYSEIIEILLRKRDSKEES